MPICQICQKNDVQFRCPTCGKIICQDCTTGGVCSSCFNSSLSAPPMRPTVNTSKSLTILGLIATFLVVIGVGMIFFFMFMFDTSIAVPNGGLIGIDRVNNLGLMADRQNGLICGFGFALFGLLLGAWDHYTKSQSVDR